MTFDPVTVAWVTDSNSLTRFTESLKAAREIVVDLETTGLDEHASFENPDDRHVNARIVLASFTLPTEDDYRDPVNAKPATWVIPLSHPSGPFIGSWRQHLLTICQSVKESGRLLTNHNLKFDLRWLFAHSQIDLTEQFGWDTQIAAHLLNENESTKLKEVVPRIFGIPRWDDHDLSTPGAAERVPLIELGLYAARDTYWAWRLAVLQRRLMFVDEWFDQPEGPDEIQDARLGQLATLIAMPTSQTLTQIEQRGLVLDSERVASEISLLESQRAEALEHLLAASWVEPETVASYSFAPTSKWFMNWANLAVESGELTVDAMTRTGKPQWSGSVLSKQARNGREYAASLLAYRKATKRLEFLNGWLTQQTRSGKIYPTYHAGRVSTGRLSCSNPNLQQVERYLKPAFVPSPGHFIAELDYSQIELRIAAEISGCQPMLEAFKDRQDLHMMLASKISGNPLDLVTAKERQEAKGGNFGFIYGMSDIGFVAYADQAYGIEFTDDESRAIRRAFFDQWIGISDWHDRSVAKARSNGFIVSPLGRVRRLPDLFSPIETLRSSAERQAINAPVQSTASDLMQLASASISGNVNGVTPIREVSILGTVHDSIVVEVPDDNWKRPIASAMKRMIEAPRLLERIGVTIEVPLEVEAKVGTRWGLADVGIIT